MKSFVDGNAVFVAPDNFVNLQVSPAVFGSTHEFCVAATVAMLNDGAKRHVSYVSSEDLRASGFGLKANGRIPRVTIEWVEETESTTTELFDI